MIRQKRKAGKPVIDLTEPEGNAFNLMGRARSFAKQLGIDSAPIIEDMISGDYEHLLAVFENHFGEYVILER
jgi:hypothetical protein